MTRDLALARAMSYYEDSETGYFADLARLVKIPTESQHAAGLPHLADYVADIRPMFEAMGFVMPKPFAVRFSRGTPLLIR